MPGDSLSYPLYVTFAMVEVFHNGLVWAKDPRGTSKTERDRTPS